jgi:hypothetical protein
MDAAINSPRVASKSRSKSSRIVDEPPPADSDRRDHEQPLELARGRRRISAQVRHVVGLAGQMVKAEPVLAPAQRPQERNRVRNGVLQQMQRDTNREQLHRLGRPRGCPRPFDETARADHDETPEEWRVCHPTVMAPRAEVVLDPEIVEDHRDDEVDVRQASPDDRARDDHVWTPLTSPTAVSSKQDPRRDMSRGKHRRRIGCRVRASSGDWVMPAAGA